jgi:hypothetical protein
MKFELLRHNFIQIYRISSCFNRRVFGAQFEFQRLMGMSVLIVEVDF